MIFERLRDRFFPRPLPEAPMEEDLTSIKQEVFKQAQALMQTHPDLIRGIQKTYEQNPTKTVIGIIGAYFVFAQYAKDHIVFSDPSLPCVRTALLEATQCNYRQRKGFPIMVSSNALVLPLFEWQKDHPSEYDRYDYKSGRMDPVDYIALAMHGMLSEQRIVELQPFKRRRR